MVPELGNFALALACCLALTQAVLSLLGAEGRDARLMSASPGLAFGQLIAVGTAFLALVWSNVVSDFSVRNVAENSQSQAPLFYRITGTWGNHDGSILLWCLVLALCGAAIAAFGGNLPSALRARVIGVLGAVAAGFLLFALTASNAFTRIWPPPMQGQGMNALLQDPALAIHPPILYLGYVGFAVPFAFAVAALIEGRVDAAWGRWVRPWALASWCFLTCGIALGSWWAYYDLGWGGFWFWDPVENSSLLPWLTGTALLHSAIVVEKREALKTWTILLAIATFALSLCGTFLTRSGILNSVHAFANDPTRGLFILALLGLVVVPSLLLFALRAPVLSPSGIFAILSREGGLVLNNILLCSIAAVVLTGTLYPPFANLIGGVQLSVGAPFFDSTVLPLAAPLILAMPLGPMLSWKRATLGPALLRLWWAALAACVVGVIAALGWHGLAALGFAGSAWLILGAAADLGGRIRLFRVPLAESLSRLAGLPTAALGAAIAHAGLGVTIAGIAGMTLASQSVTFLRPGQGLDFAGDHWTLQSLTNKSGPDYVARTATLVVSRDGRTIAVLHPSERAFPVQQTDVTDTAIRTDFLVDLYTALGSVHDGGAEVRLRYDPLAPWIWLGALVMAAGGGLSLADRRLRVGAPWRRESKRGSRAAQVSA
ncbi:MAG TPA: heme lyase CcmF/NrfE family subunit [Acetobacteraceae bacterium]|nr:heme lyase CcmF/NrfE family subunit [Acetobacteraceae bacterium]